MFSGWDYLDDPIHGDRFAEAFGSEWNDRKYPSLLVYPLEPAGHSGISLVKTDYLPEFSGTKTASVLITHNSDHNIDQDRFNQFEHCCNKWFAQNALIDNHRLIPIPIGLERPGIAGSGNIDDFRNVSAFFFGKLDRLYVNLSSGTNPAERIESAYHLEQMVWVTRQKERVPFKEYLSAVRDHTFVFSPPGNGSDTHRTYEALYMGSIPVCKNNVHNRFFAGMLPIILYDNHKDITLEFLMNEKQRIKTKLERQEYTLEALRFAWWKQLVERHAAEL